MDYAKHNQSLTRNKDDQTYFISVIHCHGYTSAFEVINIHRGRLAAILGRIDEL